MAENKTPPPALKGPSLSDTNARDSFIAAAIPALIAYQVSTGKFDMQEIGAHAVRCANYAMAFRASETAPLNVVVSKGTATPQEKFNQVVSDIVEDKSPPKSIAEIIGEAEPVAEVK